MASPDLPPHVPRLDYWSILDFTWPIELTRPSSALIRDKVRDRFTDAKRHAMLTGRVAWEILEAAKVLSDPMISWIALLRYAHTHCSPGAACRQDIPTSSYSLTKSFALAERSKSTYQRRGPTNGPALEHLFFNHSLSFADLSKSSAAPSICIGNLSPGGQLVFAYSDPVTDRFVCVASDFDEWGLPNSNSFDHSNNELLVCMFPPYTRFSKSAIKEYIRAYTNWATASTLHISTKSPSDTGSNSSSSSDERDTGVVFDSRTRFLLFSIK